jgi:hypothetical protein
MEYGGSGALLRPINVVFNVPDDAITSFRGWLSFRFSCKPPGHYRPGGAV